MPGATPEATSTPSPAKAAPVEVAPYAVAAVPLVKVSTSSLPSPLKSL
ncbi:hypothetical protein [Fodinicola feengrottensis]|nr:hypothetical protein [Fodinicola feengrottensis]